MRTAIIIPLPPAQQTEEQKKLSSQCLSHAAWNFARTLLWAERNFCREDIVRAKTSIVSYFEESTDKRKAFTIFCERIILTQKFISAHTSRYVPSPAVWFNRNYEHGFAGTKSWYHQVQAKRTEVPGYLEHISVAAHYYLDYSLSPSSKTLHKCRRKLLELNAHSLLQYFYNAIIHFTHSIKAK